MDRMALRQGLDSQIVIIGCGISGIGAAQRLIQHGFSNVRILEATARSGGRIRTGRLGSNIIEVGANWIHGPCEQNPVFCLARQYGLLDPEALTPENQAMDVGGHPPWVPNWFSSSGAKLGPDEMLPAMELFMELLEETGEFTQGGETQASAGEFIRTEASRRAAERWQGQSASSRALRLSLLSTLLKAECCVFGTPSMDLVGLGAFGLYKTLPGQDCTFPGGYDGLIQNMMKELPGGVVSYRRPVRCVHWDRDGAGGRTGSSVMVECEDGQKIPADHVILTVPLGYLKKHHVTLLQPPLPLHKQHSVQRMGFGTNNKIYVEFDAPWWDADCEVICLVWEDEVDLVDQVSDVERFWMKKLFGFTVLKPTERYGHVLCGFIAGHESEYMETLTEQEVTRSITHLVRRFTGNPTVTPRRVLRSQWFLDRWTCGSYSYTATGCSGQDMENLAEPLPSRGAQTQPLQVMFAGEATHPSFFSTVHGALLTGWREADRLISHYSAPNVNLAVDQPIRSKL